MKSAKAIAIREILDTHTQARVHVPYSDWQIYQTAREYGLDYRQSLIRHGRRWIKKLPVRRAR
jgi:hypothetical protein